MTLLGLAVVVAVVGFRLGAGDPPGALAAAVAGCPAALLLALALTRRPRAAGPLAVRAVDARPGTEPAEVLRVAAALHGSAPGPVGRALAAATDGPPGVSDLDGSPEDGLRGVVSELRQGPDGPRVVAHAALAGPPGWLAAHGLDEPAAGPGTVLVAWDGTARGAVVLGADPPRTPPAERAALAIGTLATAVGAAAGPLLGVPPAALAAWPVLTSLAVALLGCVPQHHPNGPTPG